VGAASRAARALQAAGADSSLWKLESLYGHDAFLADQDRLADLLRGAEAFGKPLKTASRPRFEGVGVEPVREIRIGLVGCGTVGGGLLEMIDRQSSAIADRYGVKFRVSRIAVRDVTKNRGPRVAGIPITDRALELVSDPEVDVVVEAAGGTSVEPILVAALAAGKPVVTANKELLASKLAELGVLAQRTETPLYCEAAAAAAIPIIRHLSHRADEIDSLWGIVNATCNFILTRLEQGDLTLAEAIEEAQRLGFAEADPTADIDGLDAAAKLSILAYRAFGAWVRPDGFLVRGIRDIDPADCDLAESMGSASGRSRGRSASTARSTWPSSRCCCRRGICSHRSKRNTTPSTCAASRRATSACSAKVQGRCPRQRRCSAI
jgi:homoserine dehydrogenase